MNQTLKVSFASGRHVKRDDFACRDEGQLGKPLGSWMMMYARLASLRQPHKGLILESATGEELCLLFFAKRGADVERSRLC